jgi:hypothetical protein
LKNNTLIHTSDCEGNPVDDPMKSAEVINPEDIWDEVITLGYVPDPNKN